MSKPYELYEELNKYKRLLKMAMEALEYCAKPDSTHRISRSTETLAAIRKEIRE